MKRHNHILLLAALIFVSSCVYPFEPKGVTKQEDIFVIEGDINLGDTSVFILSLSVAPDEIKENKPACVKASDIYVESEKGTKYGSAIMREEQDSKYRDKKKVSYTIDTRSADYGTRYRLVVKYNQKEYISQWESYLETPPIDSVAYYVDKEDGNAKLIINVSTTGVVDSLKYYKWDYEEDWEFKADFYAVNYYDPDSDDVFELPYYKNKYYCWKHERSTSINVFSTEYLNENKVINKSIVSIGSKDYRISYVYSINVHQKSISKEAFTYWETLLKNNDGTGGIFAPQPSEQRGNIFCTQNPDETVLGYISVCSIQKKRIFVYDDDINIYHVSSACEEEPIEPIKWWSQYYYYNWEVVYQDEMTGQVFWSERICVDCRTQGTKNKPVFWPTDDI